MGIKNNKKIPRWPCATRGLGFVMLVELQNNRKGDTIDVSVGIVLQGKIGDSVREGQLLAEIHASDPISGQGAVAGVLRAYSIVPHRVAPPPLILEIMGD